MVLVSPEYNSTICPALSNLIDYFEPDAYRHKPVSIVNYAVGTEGKQSMKRERLVWQF